MDVLPGQGRPVPFLVSFKKGSVSNLDIEVTYLSNGEDLVQDRSNNGSNFVHDYRLNLHLTRKSMWEPHKITYMHPAGIVSYSVLHPPSRTTCERMSAKEELPIFVNLHGAGVEIDKDLWKHSLDDVHEELPAWTIFPSGMTTWGGDDWHSWGLADVEAAVSSIPVWIKSLKWHGPKVNTDCWLVAGHSNGGQGVWFTLSHRPDKVLAAAPVSAYNSIQSYVPYTFWQETDPLKLSVLDASLGRFRHEILVPSNARGIPILQQHGSKDDNVPPLHARQMHRLLSQEGLPSKYVELDGQSHWFDGVMTTEPLQKFYLTQLKSGCTDRPENFSIVLSDTGDAGPRSGIQIDKLLVPGSLGRVDVRESGPRLALRTSNVLQLSLSRRDKMVHIDEQVIHCPSTAACVLRLEGKTGWFCAQMDEPNSKSSLERTRKQFGTIEAILRTNGTMLIQVVDFVSQRIAVQVSQNLLQYYGTDSRIINVATRPEVPQSHGNVITVGIGGEIGAGQLKNHPVTVHEGEIHIRDASGITNRYTAENSGLGAIFLRPLSEDRLELVIWGVDASSLATAARLTPSLTGTGQPDFVVTSAKCKWQGVEGVLGMGFFDSQWNVTRTSFLA